MSQDAKLLDLTLDISEGCKFSCPGCMIERENPYSEEDLLKIEGMVDSYLENGFLPFDLVLGPTDVLISTNLDDIFANETIKRIAVKFETLVINTTLMTNDMTNLDRLVEYVEEVMSGKWLRLNVPFDLKKIENERYVERIRDNLAYFVSKLETVRFYKLFLVVNYDTDVSYTRPDHNIVDDFMKLYDIDLHPDLHIDVITPHLRNGVDDLMVNEKYYRSFREIVKIMDEIAEDVRYKNRWRPIINEMNASEGDIRAYTYHRGKVYQHAFVQESMLVKSPNFDVGTVWDCDTLENLRLDRTVQQMVGGTHSRDCISCEHLFSCSNRMVPLLKETIKESRCLSPLGYTTQPIMISESGDD